MIEKIEPRWYVFYTFKEASLMEEATKSGNTVVSPMGEPAVQIGPFHEKEAIRQVEDIKGYEIVEHAYKWPID